MVKAMLRDSCAAPIGIYDSGVGGLSILQTLARRLPAEKFVYVADSGNAPYGDKSAAFIEHRALNIATFMRAQHIKALVLACNTVSAVAAASLRRAFQFPIVAMEPAIKPAVAHSQSGVVLVMGTTATIASRAVLDLCERFGKGSRILLQGCPGLVDLVEQGLIDAEVTCHLLEGYLRPPLLEGADTIVIGCTHFTFLVDAIKRIAGPGVSIVEPSEAIAMQLSRTLVQGPGFATAEWPATPVYFTYGPRSNLESFLANTVGSRCDVRALPASSAPLLEVNL
jgi:glutamate racemase